jgi:hypothetical protein
VNTPDRSQIGQSMTSAIAPGRNFRPGKLREDRCDQAQKQVGERRAAAAHGLPNSQGALPFLSSNVRMGYTVRTPTRISVPVRLPVLATAPSVQERYGRGIRLSKMIVLSLPKGATRSA